MIYEHCNQPPLVGVTDTKEVVVTECVICHQRFVTRKMRQKVTLDFLNTAFEEVFPDGLVFSHYHITGFNTKATGLRITIEKAAEIVGYDVLAEIYEKNSVPITEEIYQKLIRAHTKGL